MKSIFAMAAAIWISLALSHAQLHPDYENPKVFERGQEAAHRYGCPFLMSVLLCFPDQTAVVSLKAIKKGPEYQGPEIEVCSKRYISTLILGMNMSR